MRHRTLIGLALLAGLTVAGPGVGASSGLGGPGVSNGKAPWTSSTVDFVVDYVATSFPKNPLLKPLTTVPANQTMLISQVEFGHVRTADAPCDKAPDGTSKDTWDGGFATMSVYGCLEVDGATIHCTYATHTGAGGYPSSRWGSVSALLDFPQPGFAVPSGAAVAFRIHPMGGGGKCRYYATVIGTLIAN